MELQNFALLEEKLKILLDEYVQVKKKYQALEGLYNNKVKELEDANRLMKGLGEERDLIRTKVDSLLNMLQDIQVTE